MNSLPQNGRFRRQPRPSGTTIAARRQTRFSFLTLVAAGFVTGHLQLATFAAEATSTNITVLVSTDGSVVIGNAMASASAHGANAPTRLAFGLPRQAPVRRWIEDDAPPICHTTWEKDGIRYTETVLVTRRTPGDWTTASLPAAEAVVMVRIFGENFTNEYAGATAELAVERAGTPRRLELCNDLVFSTSGASNAFVAVLEIPASGIAGTNGMRLEFHGNMPPGNTGSMVVKIPLAPPPGENEIEQLRDLQFDQELQRVKRHWEKRGQGAPLPVRFSD